MGKRRSRLKEWIELRRQQGQLPTAIARYVHNKGGASWNKKFHWTLPEREELERLDREAAERKARKAKKWRILPKLQPAKPAHGVRRFLRLPLTREGEFSLT